MDTLFISPKIIYRISKKVTTYTNDFELHANKKYIITQVAIKGGKQVISAICNLHRENKEAFLTKHAVGVREVLFNYEGIIMKQGDYIGLDIEIYPQIATTLLITVSGVEI